MSRHTRSASPAFESDPPRETANDRFKRGFGPTFWSSVIGAVAVHFAFFALFPTLSVADMTVTEERTELLDLLPETRLPEQPEPIRRPAAPIVAEVDLELTIDRNVPLPGEQVRLPAPPVSRAGEQSRPEYFTPYTVAPRLLNAPEVQRLLERRYPAILRDAGIGGTVGVWLRIDERGGVLETRLDRSSGYDAFDEAALGVGRAMRFSPAMNRDRRVPVWVSVPIRFDTR
jgi:TonB family protein